MTSLIVSRTASTSNYTPDFKPHSATKRSSSSHSINSSSNSTPNSIHSGPPSSSPSSKKIKKQKVTDENEKDKDKVKSDEKVKESSSSASSPSNTSQDSQVSKGRSDKTVTPASSDTYEQMQIDQSKTKGKGKDVEIEKEPLLIKSLVRPNSNFGLFNPNNSSIAALLEDPVEFHSTKSNLNIVKYKPINDPDYVSEFASTSKKGKGKEREIQQEEEEDGSADEDEGESKDGDKSNSMEAKPASTSKLSKSMSSSSRTLSNPNSNSQNSSPSKSEPAKNLYLHTINLSFPSISRKVGRGLNNSGNTCYLNSTLQALIHTPPLLSSLLTRKSSEFTNVYSYTQKRPHPNQFLALNALQIIAKKAMQGNGSGGSQWPGEISNRLKEFAKPLRKGRQEDAHEFLRFLLEAMQQQCVGFHKLTPNSPVASTTLPHRIFGGKLRSRVHCLSCKANSDTLETFLDLSLDINGRIFSLDDALKSFTRIDRLEGSEKYKCEKCKKKVIATKQFTIDSLPPILTIHFKRFTLTGGKLNKLVDFPEQINMMNCLSAESRSTEPVPKYRLYAVVHHLGTGPNSGHYISTVRDVDGRWKTMDDSFVSSASTPVGDKTAYILFYQRMAPTKLEQLTSASGSSNNSKNPFTNTSSPSTSNAIASSSRLPQSQVNGNNNQQKKRKLIDDDEDVGQAQSRVDRVNGQSSGPKLVDRIVPTPNKTQENQTAFKRSNATTSSPSIAAKDFYAGKKNKVKRPLDSIGGSTRSNQDEEDDDEDDDGSSQRTPHNQPNSVLSKKQRRKLSGKDKKKKSSAHGSSGELGSVKNFMITPGMDNISQKEKKGNQGTGEFASRMKPKPKK